MKGRTLHLGLAAALLMPAVQGADVNRSWETLIETLKPGRKVVVVRHNKTQVEGKVLSLASDSITVRVKGQPLAVQRDDVFRVRVADIRRRNTLIGMAAGAGVMAIWGASNASWGGPEGALLAAAIFGVGPGAAVGGALPIGVPLYEHPGGLRTTAP